MDPGTKQRFACIDIADSDHTSSIHQKTLHRSSPTRRQLPQCGAIPRFRERFDSEMPEVTIPSESAARLSEHQPEPSWIAEAQPLTPIEIENHVLVISPGSLRRHQRKASTHSEMDDEHYISCELDQQIFRSSTDSGYGTSDRQTGKSRLIDDLSQVGLLDSYALDRPADQNRHQGLPQDLDFGKLRHESAFRPSDQCFDGLVMAARQASSQTNPLKTTSGRVLSPFSRSSDSRTLAGRRSICSGSRRQAVE